MKRADETLVTMDRLPAISQTLVEREAPERAALLREGRGQG